MEVINYPLIIMSALAAIASPGSATLAIASVSMSHGRIHGLVLACGIITSSLFWSSTAAFGLATVLQANDWFFEFIRYCGAIYLVFLSFKFIYSAFRPSNLTISKTNSISLRNVYFKGVLIHLTNPKAILFFVSLYSIGVPASAQLSDLISVIFSVGIVSACIFIGYAVLFSNSSARNIYLKSKVTLECTFAIYFGFTGIKILTSDFGK